MANMNKLDMLNTVRYLIRERLPTGQTEGNWNNTQLFLYIDQGLWDAYYDEINADNGRFLTTSEIEGDGSELYDLPSDFVKIHSLVVTSELTNYSYAPYTEFALPDRENPSVAVKTNRGFYFAPDGQIGIRPAPSVDLTIRYYKQFAELDNEGVTESDLHPLSQHLACLYAAKIALIDRGDTNVTGIENMIINRKQRLSEIRRSSMEPYALVSNPSYNDDQGYFTIV